ncbi:MAG: response regulator [Bacteroidales bacterium]|nr:response regulator [Bacteroidales bacterium]
MIGEGKREASRRKRKVIVRVLIAVALLLFASCEKKENKSVEYSRQIRVIDSLVAAAKTMQQMNDLIDSFYVADNVLGRIVALREQGRRYRNESSFDMALKSHAKSLSLAQSIQDTFQYIQALNNIGTDYRRMGMLDLASEFHYRALDLCPTDTNLDNVKNRVVSLNGLGNIYMGVGNYEQADSMFRQALLGEKKVGSKVGVAINYANLGSIYQKQGNVDSAWIYFRQSMRYNKEAGSDVGIALCHTYFGNLHETRQEYDAAIAEYTLSYGIMSKSKDEWHALTPCLALARISFLLKRNKDVMKYIDEAEVMATSIRSPEHLAQIYKLLYQVNLSRGDDKAALESYIKSVQYNDSVVNFKKINEIQNVRMNIERGRQQEKIRIVESNLHQERKSKRVGFIVFSLAVLALLLVIGQFVYVMRLQARQQKIQKELQETKDRFFTNITHEFRTPLTVIQAAASELQTNNKAGDESIERASTSIMRQSDGLLQLVNQLLDIAKMSAVGAIVEPEWRRGNIVDFISNVVEGYLDFAAGKGLKIGVNAQLYNIQMDFIPDYMQKILRNLLSNSIKFTESGGSITVSIKKESDNLMMSVTDTGQGMTEEEQQHVFEPFYQASSGIAIFGTGVGLSVAKMAVDSMGGDIRVTSKKGEGTRFDIRLPLKHGKEVYSELGEYKLMPVTELKADAETALVDDVPENEGATRILIVEDSHEVAFYMARQLNKYYHISFAVNGNEGFEKAKAIVPDLIISDIMMPGIDGYQLCKQIRADELLCHIPILMVTAKVTSNDRLRGIEAGCDGYVEKPFRSEELRVRVEKLLEMRRRLQIKYSGQQPRGEQASADVVEEVVQGDSETNTKTGFLSVQDQVFLDKMTAVVKEHLDDSELTAATLADHMSLTRHQLNRKVNAITGDTTTTFITNYRLDMAKEYLRGSTTPIAEVSAMCGFNGVAYFSSLFKKHTGVTPSQWRAGQGETHEVAS